MPPMTIGILDQDATDSLLLSNPELYKQGRLGILILKILKRMIWNTSSPSTLMSILEVGIFYL